MANWKRIKRYYHYYGMKSLWLKVVKHRQVQFGNYNMWRKENTLSNEEGNRQRSSLFPFMPKISIAVPTYETPEKYLREMIDSVRRQTYSNWELCIADGSVSLHVYNIVNEYAQRDTRIIIKKLECNEGIVGNSNVALQMCTGEYIGFLDHDDLLAKNALFEVVKAINEEKCPGVLYSDEDKISSNSDVYFEPHFKSNFNIDLLRSNNYICHFCVIKTDVVKEIGGFRKEYEGAQDYDLILRSVEKTENIIHIPKVLYHWRTHELSTAENPESKRYAYIAGKKALSAHLRRCGLSGTINMLYHYGFYHVQYKLQRKDKVVVVICGSRNEREEWNCRENIVKTSGYDNLTFLAKKKWSDLKAQDVSGDYILFVDYRIRMLTPNWMGDLVALCQRKGTGAVGIKLYNKRDESIYHGGIILGMSGYMFEGFPREAQEKFHRDELQQNVSGVSKDFMMISKPLLERIQKNACGNITEFNVLKSLHDYKNLVVADLQVQAYIDKHEMKNHMSITGIEEKDYYYNRNLSLKAPGFSIQ